MIWVDTLLEALFLVGILGAIAFIAYSTGVDDE